ncbi:uncharacterized protein [Pithys albifrons albifrons]|uniref:uncharacterized protein n=1 Tax=Pithys albifrons albifrons TaxID=3385563 RepID=UPI003A5CB2BC
MQFLDMSARRRQRGRRAGEGGIRTGVWAAVSASLLRTCGLERFGGTAQARSTERRRYCSCAEYRAPSQLRTRGVQSGVAAAHARSTERRLYCARAEYSEPSQLRTRGVQLGVAIAHARSTARRRYCACAEYRAASVLRMRGVQSASLLRMRGVQSASLLRMRGVQSGVAIAHARSTARRPSCACPESASLSLLLDATSRVRSWRCFPAPAAAGAAGARGEHPAAGAAAAEAFLERGAGTIARSAAAKIPGVLGGFLKLIASKASDPQGFDLLNSIMEHMPPESVDWYRKQVFILLFQRLPSSKPTKLIKRFLCCRPSLLGLFELPEDDTTPDKEHFIDTEDTPGYQTAFSQLAFAGKKEHDPVGQMVNNPRIQLAQSLHKLFTACPGRVGGLGSASLGCIQQRRNASVRMVSC